MARPMCLHGYIDEAIGHCDECHPIDRRPLSLEEEIIWRADKGPILGPDHEHIARLWATLDAVRAQQSKCRVSVWYDVNHLTGGDKYRECGNTLPCPRHP